MNRAVLDKALIDSFSPHEAIRLEAEEFFDLTEPDFITACELAMLSPEGVYEGYKAYKKILRGKNAKFNRFTNKK